MLPITLIFFVLMFLGLPVAFAIGIAGFWFFLTSPIMPTQGWRPFMITNRLGSPSRAVLGRLDDVTLPRLSNHNSKPRTSR